MKKVIPALGFLFFSSLGNAQHMHEMNDMPMHDSADHMSHSESMMTSGLSLHLPMSRDGSGTSWQPDATPVYGYMSHAGAWMFMFGGDAFPRYERQDITNAGNRGGDKWDAPDRVMAMGQRKVGKKGLFRVNLMLSADAMIDGGNGYPLLLQTGESWKGYTLVDRQHPHDLLSELSASYSYSLTHKADIYAYIGYPGEPALGPVTFMHRSSGRFMPDAPISHHWADATHITFGVATVGVRYGKFKIEGSSFTGREPDDQRFNVDKPTFDSWSGRLSFNPSANWALQVSRGYLKSPEALHPAENVNRTTASATFVYPMSTDNYFTFTALYGSNETPGMSVSNAVLGEATLKLKKLAVYARAEWVQKTGAELQLPVHQYSAGQLYAVITGTIGAGYDLFQLKHIVCAAGAQVAVNNTSNVSTVYGSYPLGGEVYLHLYPGRIK